MNTAPPRPSRTAVVALNPFSRRAGDLDRDAVRAALAHYGIDADVVAVDDTGGMREVLERRAPHADLVIVGGGDGTLRGAAATLLRLNRPVGLLPLGTANDLARGLGIPPDVEAAIRIIGAGHTRLIDVAYANAEPYFNGAGIGLGPALTQEMDGAEKRRLGVIAYLTALLRALGKQGTFRVVIDCDDVPYRLRVSHVTVSNGRYYGGGMTVRHDALLDDGLLDLVALRADSLAGLLRIGPMLRWGFGARSEQLFTCRGRRIRVRTRRPMRVSTDGELTTQTPVEFAVATHRLRIFTALDADALQDEVPTTPA